MRFKADEIASVIQQEIEQYEARIDVREVGRVLEVGDGIARVYGLSGVMAGEMVEFPTVSAAWPSIWKRIPLGSLFWETFWESKRATK